MNPTSSRLVAFAAVVGVAACIDIAAGPNGVLSIGRPVPPRAIILGDTLRDSLGVPLRLRPVGYGENGAAITDLPFTYTALAVGIDTVNGKPIALRTDSASKLVIAPTTWLDDSGRVALTFANKLQIVDTFLIVPRPRRLTRTDTARQRLPDTTTFFFDCTDEGTILSRDTLPPASVRVYKGTAYGNITTLSIRRLTGDSVNTEIPVRRYLVRYVIDSVGRTAGSAIPTITLKSGAKRPVVGLVVRAASPTSTPDTPINFDTTDALGISTVRLRIFPSALRDTLVPVYIHTIVRTSPTNVVVDSAVVRLRRFVVSPTDSTPLSCPTP